MKLFTVFLLALLVTLSYSETEPEDGKVEVEAEATENEPDAGEEGSGDEEDDSGKDEPMDPHAKIREAFKNGTLEHWHYRGDHGPHAWGEFYPQCAGINQSPISFTDEDCEYTGDKVSNRLEFVRYDDPPPREMNMVNDGRTLRIDIKSDAYIQNSGLPNTYRAFILVFHWGNDNEDGSEHMINGKKAPMEMHIKHYSITSESVIQASLAPYGFGVLSVQFEIGEESNPGFNEIIAKLGQVSDPVSDVDLTPFPLERLLPEKRDDYYMYHGSLTMPGCTPNTIWVLLREKVKISQAQMDAFRSIKSNDGLPLVNNFRELQDIGERKVYRMFKTEQELANDKLKESNKEEAKSSEKQQKKDEL